MHLTREAQDAERTAIVRALSDANGNVVQTAKYLDMSKRTLWRRLRDLDICPKDLRK